MRLAGQGKTSKNSPFVWTFTIDRQHDAQTQASSGSAISHRYAGGNVAEGLLFGLARSVCSFALSDGLISVIYLLTVSSLQHFSSFCLGPIMNSTCKVNQYAVIYLLGKGGRSGNVTQVLYTSF